MANGDKRSVSTDALETLGTIIDDRAGRDAIHLAVEPVKAGERLQPGQHIGVASGLAYATVACKKLGIVDINGEDCFLRVADILADTWEIVE